MDVEDFDDEPNLTPAQLIARERAAFGGGGLNSDLRGGGALPKPSARPAPSPLKPILQAPAQPAAQDGYDSDADLTPAQLIAKQRAALGGDGLNSDLRGGRAPPFRGAPSPLKPLGGAADQGAFGLDAETADDLVGKDGSLKQPLPLPARGFNDSKALRAPPPAVAALESDLQQMDLRDTQPRALPPPRAAGAAFGLEADVSQAMQPQPARRPSLDADPYRRPSGARPMESSSYGLESEVQAAADPLPLAAGPRYGPPADARPAPVPATQPPPPPAYGLAAETARRPSPLGQPQPLAPLLQAAPQLQQQLPPVYQQPLQQGGFQQPQMQQALRPAGVPQAPTQQGQGQGQPQFQPLPQPQPYGSQPLQLQPQPFGAQPQLQPQPYTAQQPQALSQQQPYGVSQPPRPAAAPYPSMQAPQMQPSSGGAYGGGPVPTQPGPMVAPGQAQYPLLSDMASAHMLHTGDPAAAAAQQQVWSQPLLDTFSLEQLPADQRYIPLHARQAERVMLDLAAQGQAPKVVDIKDVREKLLNGSAPQRLAYLATVEQAAPDRRFPDNCRPSLLQTKLKTGANRLTKLVEPVVEPGSQGFVDLKYMPDGALEPESNVWQFGISLVQADGVGKTGLRHVRQPCLYIARMALFDKRSNRFLGNVCGVRPDDVQQAEKRWVFNPDDDRVIVRCSSVQSDPQAGTQRVTDEALSLYVELNVSYRLTVEDTVNMPQSEAKASHIVDEVNTCWAMISFKKCVSLQREVQISVPLYYGSIYDPQPMDVLYHTKRAKTPFRSMFKAKDNPVLQFRAGPLNAAALPLVPYPYMPTTMIALPDLATALGAHRMCLCLSLARQAGSFVAASDPVLAAFPGILGDHHVLREFLTKWKDTTTKMTAIMDRGCCSPDVLPPLGAVVEAFRRCTIELAPLVRCQTIPAKHINNFIEYQGHRLKLVQRYCHVMDPKSGKIAGARHPVEPLSHAGFEYLHTPFDVSEVRLCMADRLERPAVFYKH